MGDWGRVLKRNDDGTPFISIKNEHLIKKTPSRWINKMTLIVVLLPWLLFTIIWNFYWPEASPVDDVFVATCLYFFNRSFVGRFRND